MYVFECYNGGMCKDRGDEKGVPMLYACLGSQAHKWSGDSGAETTAGRGK